ncbi:MAG: cell wall hydrolase [Clostridia bacterium]|nr:cell wall hydrolase [Clostridia bacterium]
MLNAHCKKTTLRMTASILILCMLICSASFPASAAIVQEMGEADENSVQRSSGKAVSVLINGKKYTGNAFLKDGSTYVGIREFSMYMGASSVSWDGGKKTCTVKSDNLSLSAKNGSSYITANERFLWASSGIIIISGTMYAPIRPLAKAFGYSVDWSQKDQCAILTPSAPLISGRSFYKADEILWLSRIIHAEAQGEPFLGKIAVGTVVLNRVKNSMYPNTIYGVIFDRKNGVQFTPAQSGTIYCSPNEESIIAAKLCLDGARINDKVLFFVNEELATSSWVSDNRPFIMTVGNHKFFA